MSELGPGLRNCDELCIRNGSTPPAQGVGSWAVVPFGATGSQYPGFAFGTNCDGPNRPSSCLESIIACAAAVPAAIPIFLNGESGMAFFDALYCASSDASTVALNAGVNEEMVKGTVSTMFFRTRYAAVATAASSDAVFPNRLFRRYGR